jgi:hypothetical protein
MRDTFEFSPCVSFQWVLADVRNVPLGNDRGHEIRYGKLCRAAFSMNYAVGAPEQVIGMRLPFIKDQMVPTS